MMSRKDWGLFHWLGSELDYEGDGIQFHEIYSNIIDLKNWA